MNETDIRGQAPVQRTDINRVLRGTNPEVRAMLLTAHKQGFKVTPTKSNHYSVSTPKGVRPMLTKFMSKTPSDARGLHRMRAKLRQIGVVFSR